MRMKCHKNSNLTNLLAKKCTIIYCPNPALNMEAEAIANQFAEYFHFNQSNF